MTKGERELLMELYDSLYDEAYNLVSSFHRGEFKVIATEKYGYDVKEGTELNLDSLVAAVGDLRCFLGIHQRISEA